MAPEQWEGKPQGAKTDQYALAVMAYEMLAGHLPFENVNWQVLKEAVLHGDIASIPGAPWRAMEALQRGLSKNGEERYRSCGEFVAALRGRNTVKISPRATNAPTGGTTPAASKGKEKKKRAGWGWLAALALAVGLGAGAWWWQGRTTTASQEAADTESLEVAPSGPAGEEPFESPREEEVDDSLQGIQLQEELPSGIRHQMEEIQRRVEEAERRLEEERAAAEKTRHELEEWLARMKQQQEPTARERNTEEEKNPVQTPPLGEERRAGEERVFTLPGGARMVMVWCPAGSFMMGESGRQHPVTLTHGFWLAKHEVTQAQWKSVMGRGNNPSHFKGDDLPVESVTSDYLRDFCRKAGLRLPTEAEWEYACRAGSTTEYFWGNTLNGDKANCDGNSPYGTWMKGTNLGKTTQGGKYPANRWGFCDMHGNVWERCADWYGDYPAGAVTNPTGPFSGSARVYRGGSWDSSAGDCRSAKRGRNPPSGSAGFRPARTPL
jgi:formylglycine-generating enzyme required for sulfatase activity